MIAIGNHRAMPKSWNAPAVKGRSLWVDARRRLLRNRAAVASIIVLALIALLALLAPLLSPYAYDEINYDIISCAPRLVAGGGGLQRRRHPLVRHRCGGPRPVRAGAVSARGCRWRWGWWRRWCRC